MKQLILASMKMILLLMMSYQLQAANAINDRSALADLSVGKGVFLIDIGDAKKLNFYLKIIQGTFQRMQNQNVKAEFVLVYIGPSVKYLTTAPSAEVEQSMGDVLLDIESNVEKLSALGIRQEVCAVATDAFGIANDSLVEGLELVGDGFISLIGYQSQGYHLVPVF